MDFSVKIKGHNACKALTAGSGTDQMFDKAYSYLIFLLSIRGLWMYFPEVHLSVVSVSLNW